MRAEQNGEAASELGKKGILFAVAPEGASFILPDRSFKSSRLDGTNERQKNIWIPIHPKYAVSTSLSDGTCERLHLTKSQVRELNEHWYQLANTVVSTSKKQLISLVKNCDRKKINFENG